jgi:hypothetical protein
MGFSALEQAKAKGAVPVGAALAVRPPRVAVLVPPLAGCDWRSLFESALATQCGLWGGEGNIVLPWDDDQLESPLFWQLLRCHDPDILAAYTPSLGELALVDRTSYDAQVEEIKASLVTLDGIGEEQRREFLEDRLKEPAAEFDLGAPFELVRERLSVLDGDQVFGWFGLQGSEDPGYPFTDLKSLGVPEDAVNDPVCGLGETARLLLCAHVGRLPPRIRRWLADEGRVNQRNVGSLGTWLLDVSERRRNRSRIDPWDFSRSGLGWYDLGHRDRQVVIVVGDEPMDFALFYLLLRVNQPAFWMPREGIREDHLAEYNQRVLSDMAQVAGQRGIQKISVTSATAAGWRDQFVGELQAKMATSTLQILGIEPDQVLPRQPSRLFEEDAQGQRGELVLDLAGHSQPLSTPIPRRVRSADPFALRWITDVRLDDWTPMNHNRLASKILKAPSNSVRIADTGPAYLCPLHTTFGREGLESLTSRPTLHRLDLLEQVQKAVSADGWQAKPSDKGIYAEQTTLLFGGLDILWTALLQQPTRALFDCYLAHTVGRKFRDRTYLQMEDAPVGVDLLQRYELLGILRRGLALKCERCRQGEFYEIESVGRTFQCARCGLDQIHGLGHWLGASGPEWHFGLAEVVYQFLQHDGDIPVQAARTLLEGSKQPVAVAFELELQDVEDRKSEHDLILTRGSRLLIGEATAKDHLEKPASKETERLQRLSVVADMLEAEAVVLATTQPRFTKATVDRARKIVERPWRPLELIEGLKRDPD